MSERASDSSIPGWVILAVDTPGNAERAKKQIEKGFPVSFSIVSDPVEISRITPNPVPDGQVLIQAKPMERVDTVAMFKAWSDSLQQDKVI